MISPAGVSQAWREQGVGWGGREPQLLVLKTQGKASLSALLGKEWQMKSIQEALGPSSWSSNMGVGGVCTASPCGHLPWVWHCARKSPEPGWMPSPTLIRASCGALMVTGLAGPAAWQGEGGLPSLMCGIRLHLLLPPCIILWRGVCGRDIRACF